MKKDYLFIVVALMMGLFSCEKTEKTSDIDSLSKNLYFSCKVNNRDIFLRESFGSGSFCKRFYEFDLNEKDSFLLGHFQDFADGGFKIWFSKKLLLDTAFNYVNYIFNPDIDLKAQIFQTGSRDFPEILYGQEGIFIEYNEAVEIHDDIDYIRNWTSYLKAYPDDESNIIVDMFQNNSSCEIVNYKKVGESGVYIEAVFNCILYDDQSGDTLILSDGNLKCIF